MLNRGRAMALLQKEAELQEIVKLVGQDALSPADNLTLESAKMIREDFLQQNAFLENDQYSSFDRQARLLELILRTRISATRRSRAARISGSSTPSRPEPPSAVRRPSRRNATRTSTRRSKPTWNSRSKKWQRRLRLNDPGISYHP